MKLLNDETGKPSSIRLMSIVSLGAAIWFGYLTIMLNSDTGLYLTSLFMAGAFAPKVIQKMIERMPVGKS